MMFQILETKRSIRYQLLNERTPKQEAQEEFQNQSKKQCMERLKIEKNNDGREKRRSGIKESRKQR